MQSTNFILKKQFKECKAKNRIQNKGHRYELLKIIKQNIAADNNVWQNTQLYMHILQYCTPNIYFIQYLGLL